MKVELDTGTSLILDAKLGLRLGILSTAYRNERNVAEACEIGYDMIFNGTNTDFPSYYILNFDKVRVV